MQKTWIAVRAFSLAAMVGMTVISTNTARAAGTSSAQTQSANVELARVLVDKLLHAGTISEVKGMTRLLVALAKSDSTEPVQRISASMSSTPPREFPISKQR